MRECEDCGVSSGGVSTVRYHEGVSGPWGITRECGSLELSWRNVKTLNFHEECEGGIIRTKDE